MESDCVPDDLIFGILLWVPVASLLRLKCVCKSWYSLIQSSHFVYQHHRFTSSHQDNVVLITLSHLFDVHVDKQTVLSLSDNNNNNWELLEFPNIHDPYQSNRVHLIASCNGIICLRQGRTVCLWNPATKQSTTLPPLPVPALCCHIGFGFCLQTNDYKVLCIDTNKIIPTAHIYSLTSDSWTSIQGSDLSDLFNDNVRNDLKAPYKTNMYYWMIQNYVPLPYQGTRSCLHSILSFDFTTEVFGTIPLPMDSAARRAGAELKLCILRENIAFIKPSDNHEDLYFQVWMLNDYNVKASWTKLYSITHSLPFLNFPFTFGYSMNGDFLLICYCSELLFFDLATQQVTKRTDFPFDFDTFPTLMYEESLVSIQRGNAMANMVNTKFQDQNGKMFINQPMTGNNCGNTSIPESMVFHILSWLPVVSLLRFKLVCRFWYSLIKSSKFVAQHLRYHHQNDSDNVNFILNSYSPVYYPLFEHSTHSVCHTSCTCLLSSVKFELLDLPYRESWVEDSVTVVTSFDGIICLQVERDCDLYLWNPATKQFRAVLVEAYQDNEYAGDFFFGFGFDVKTNDYKLVRFSGVCDGSIKDVAEVYNLSTDSWRRIDKGISPTFERISSGNGLEAPYQNGTYCWLALIDYTTNSHMIVLFDFSTEVFGTIPLPDSINKSSSSLVKLAVLRENIACISTDENYFLNEAENWQCNIWMMNEFGVKESWTKLYTVGRFSQDWRLHIGYSMKNQDYILLQRDGKLYMFNLVTQEIKRLPVQAEGSESYQVVLYQESLVPIKMDIANGYCK